MPFPPIVIMDGSLRHNNNTPCLERHLHYFGSQLHDQTGYHSSQLHDQTRHQPQVEVIDRVQVTTDKPFTNGHGVSSSESSATLPIQATSATFEVDHLRTFGSTQTLDEDLLLMMQSDLVFMAAHVCVTPQSTQGSDLYETY